MRRSDSQVPVNRSKSRPSGANGGEKAATLNRLARRRLPRSSRWEPIPKTIKLASGSEHIQTREEAWIDVRHLVRHYAAMGYTRVLICQLLAPPINDAALAKLFAPELEFGLAIQNARVGATAYSMATSGQDGSMTRFWLRNRAGWTDFEGSEHRGPVKVAMIPGDDTI